MTIDAHDSPPEEITLDIDPTNLETFGQQLGRHFQKHDDGYCYLPQYVFCGEFLLAAQLRPGDVGAMSGAMSGAMKLLPKIVTRIRQRWPDVRITIRGDGHFSDDRLMSWCEATPGLEFIVGMPSNARLMNEVQEAQRQMAAESAAAKQSDENSGPQQKPPRTFVEIPYRTLDSWSQQRRVVAKVEHLPGPTGDSVSALAVATAKSTRKQAQRAVVLARKEQRAAAKAERRVETLQTQAAAARTRLFKIGALIQVTTRRVWTHFSSSYPYRELFGQVLSNLRRAAEKFSSGVPSIPDPSFAGDAPPRLACT